MSFFSTVPPRPSAVNVALVIALASSLAGVLNLFFLMPGMLASLEAQGLPAEAVNPAIMYGVAVFSVILTCVVCFFIARGNNVLRWIWAAFSAYGLLSALGGISMVFGISAISGVISVVLQLAAIASVILLFLPASSAWFKAVKQEKSASVANNRI